MLKLLASDGMLVKRPLLIGDGFVLVGFKETEWKDKIQEKQNDTWNHYTSEQVKKMIERQKEKYGWEFLFIGANIDAVETAARYGIDKDRAVNYNADGEGTHILYESVEKAISNVRASAPLSENWSDEINADYQRRGNKKI